MAVKVAQQIKKLATKFDNLCSVSLTTHMVKKKDSHKMSSDLYSLTHTHTQRVQSIRILKVPPKWKEDKTNVTRNYRQHLKKKKPVLFVFLMCLILDSTCYLTTDCELKLVK